MGSPIRLLPAIFSIFIALVRLTFAEDACSYCYITQHIDHFGKHNGSFQQRYSMITEYFKPGRPILFFQGEETDTLDCAVRICHALKSNKEAHKRPLEERHHTL